MKFDSKMQDDIRVFVNKMEQYASALASETSQFDCAVFQIQSKYFLEPASQAYFDFYKKFRNDLETFRVRSSELAEHLRKIEAFYQEMDEIDSHAYEMVERMRSQKLTY